VSSAASQRFGTDGPFESFRGALINGAGTIVFYATPRGGTLGVFTTQGASQSSNHERVVGIGDTLFGSPVKDFALNPVSLNEAGQIAIRILLEDGKQMIVLAYL
jgi:hypothetical protein